MVLIAWFFLNHLKALPLPRHYVGEGGSPKTTLSRSSLHSFPRSSRNFLASFNLLCSESFGPCPHLTNQRSQNSPIPSPMISRKGFVFDIRIYVQNLTRGMMYPGEKFKLIGLRHFSFFGAHGDSGSWVDMGSGFCFSGLLTSL